jgi:HSP20 family protein
MSSLIRWSDPFGGISDLHSQIDDMFNSFFNTSGVTQASASVPAMDVYDEDGKQLVAEVHVPGFSKDNINVSVHSGMLEISGEHKEKEEDKDKGKKRSYVIRESSTSFYRRIALPKYADGDNIQAEFENGVLKVTVPFKELPQPKRIQIASGKTNKK